MDKDVVGADKDSKDVKSVKVKNNSRKSKNKMITLIIIILLCGVGFFAYRYSQSQKEVKVLSNPQEAARQETAKITAAVSKLVQLPSGESPTLATVSDANKLKNQAFFANAQNGDKVLIFTQAKTAVLYRPSTNKVIEKAPINLGSSNSNNN